MKYYIYCRVSSDSEDKQVLGIPSQVKELTAYAETHGLEIVEVLSERGSAYKKGRPIFNKMLSDIEAGKANGILVYHLSRIARNSLDGGNVIYMMDDKIIKELRTPEKVYTNCSDDKFLMQIHFAMNKKSSDDNSQFVKRDIKAKLEKKEYPGRVPLGYLNISPNGSIAGRGFDPAKQELLTQISQKRSIKRIELDPILSPLVKQLFNKALIGNLSLRQLGEEAFKLGLVGQRTRKKLTKSTVDRILRNPFYHGTFYYDNQYIEGDYEPIITKAEYEKIQSNLNGASRPASKKREYVYSQVILCGGCRKRLLSGDYQKGIYYYRCTESKRGNCKQNTHYQHKHIETQILEKLSEVQLDKDIVEFLIRKLEKENKTENTLEEQTRRTHQKRLNTLKDKQNRLLEAWISEENQDKHLLSDEIYSEKKQSIQKEIEEAESLIVDRSLSHDEFMKRAEKLFSFSCELINQYEKASVNDKRAILSLIGTNYVMTDGQLTLEVAEPFSYLVSLNKNLAYVRTAKKPISISDKADFEQKAFKWRDVRDSNSQPPA